jgi:Putative heavy-metal-binding
MTGPGEPPAADGDLPEAARRRLGEGAWSSGLSIPDFASCVSLGMEPLGFVQGYAVMQWAWYAGNYSNPYLQASGLAAPAKGQYGERWNCPHGFVGTEHRIYGVNFEQTIVEGQWKQGFGLAFHRMMEEAAELGAHGVIGVVDELRTMTGTNAHEFVIRGTAVRVPETPVPAQPFSTYLSGQKLAKILEAGYVPVSVVASLGVVQMIGYCITHYQMAGTAAGGWSSSVTGVHPIDQVNRAQGAARHVAREHARSQLHGDLLHGATLSTWEREIGEGDLSIHCQIKGTRVRRFKDFARLDDPEPVVRLG